MLGRVVEEEQEHEGYCFCNETWADLSAEKLQQEIFRTPTSIINVSPIVCNINRISAYNWANDDNEKDKTIRDDNSNVSVLVGHQSRIVSGIPWNRWEDTYSGIEHIAI